MSLLGGVVQIGCAVLLLRREHKHDDVNVNYVVGFFNCKSPMLFFVPKATERSNSQ